MGTLNLSALKNKHFLVLMNNGFTYTINFAISYLLFHYLSMEATGMYFFVIMFVTLCGAARDGFLATSTVTFYAGATPERGATVLGSVWFLALALSFIILGLNAIGFLCLPYIHNEEYILCIKWVGITYLGALPSSVVFWRLQADEHYGKMLAYRILCSISTFIALLVLIKLHIMTLENALLWNFLTNAMCSLIGILWNKSGIKYLFHKSKECIIELFHYGKYTLGTTSLSVLLGNLDTLIINFMLGPAAIAVYNLSQRFMAVVELPVRTFLTTGMSEMAIARNKSDSNQVTYIFKKYTGMLTIGLIPVVILAILLADFPINILGGAKYHGTIAANAFRLFIIISLLYPFDRFNGLALDVTRHTKINFYKMMIMLIATIIGDFTGLSIFGNIYGIALSDIIVIVPAILYGNYQLHKYMEYTIPGILSLGYAEIKQFIGEKLKFDRQRT